VAWAADAPLADVLASAPVLAQFQKSSDELGAKRPPAVPTVLRALCLLSEPPTLDRGEITDKGSINQRCGAGAPRKTPWPPCTTVSFAPSSNPRLNAQTNPRTESNIRHRLPKDLFNAFADIWMHEGVRTPDDRLLRRARATSRPPTWASRQRAKPLAARRRAGRTTSVR